MNIAIVVGTIALWGIVHSLLASVAVKDSFRRLAGAQAMRAYRFLYNVFAIVSFAPILGLMRMLPDHALYVIPAPWMFFTLAGQGIAALLLLIALFQTDALAFIGLRQLLEGESPSILVADGFYRVVRHPLYLFGLVILWLTPFMTLNLLIVNIGLTLYLFLGAYFEERKLLREFGAAYSEYKAVTPMFIPGLKFKQHQ
jgi:protein-S-isoprenylcysteine O-methyltransferase Ste14